MDENGKRAHRIVAAIKKKELHQPMTAKQTRKRVLMLNVINHISRLVLILSDMSQQISPFFYASMHAWIHDCVEWACIQVRYGWKMLNLSMMLLFVFILYACALCVVLCICKHILFDDFRACIVVVVTVILCRFHTFIAANFLVLFAATFLFHKLNFIPKCL